MTRSGIRFSKLEALGNDFALIDARDGKPVPPQDSIQRLADRHSGIGFDQMLILHPAESGAAARVEIINADGSVAEQCGNGMRAIAAWLARRGELDAPVRLVTPAGAVEIDRADDNRYRAVLPGPKSSSPDALGLPSPKLPPGISDWRVISMGNPHLVAWQELPPSAVALAELVDALDRQTDWSARVNIGLAGSSDGEIQLRVHERGVGPTRACGSGACAAAAAMPHPGGEAVRVRQPGGTLVIDLDPERGRVVTIGPARVVFEGYGA